MSDIVLQTVMIVGGGYINLWLLQVLTWPLARKLFGDLPDEGWVVSRFFGLMITSLCLWNLAHLGFAVNTNLGIMIFMLLIVLSGVIILKSKGVKFLVPKTESLKIIFLEEYLFMVGFAGICFVRSFLPNLDSLEKFMDYGFIVRYFNSPTLPAWDMWQAGSFINYYSFGHYWASVLIRFLGVAPEIGYNLVLGFVAGQSLSLAFLICYWLGKNANQGRSMIGGLLGALVVVFGGNSHTMWYLLKNQSLNGYWYADATRFIHNTIHEFPGYSLVVSDLHGHLLDLPNALFFVIAFYLFTKRNKIEDGIVLGCLLAIMMMTNTWDVPIYGLLVCVWMASRLIYKPKEIGFWIQKMLVVFGVMALVSIPWWIKFEPISSGIAWVKVRSPLWQLGVLWGGAIIVNILAWIKTKGKSDSSIFIRTIIVTSILLVLIPEIVYAKDIYPDHPRANTMFKLTYQACIMVGLVFGSLLGRVTDEIKNKFSWIRGIVLGVCLFIFGFLMIFPTVSYPSFYENFKTFRGLDGELWLKNKYPEKYVVIQYLKQNKDGKNMVEAVGDSYTDLNAVSVFSGVPTIQGWRVHEWLWRGGYDSVAVREQEVKKIYESGDKEETKRILEKYNVGWVWVGQDEEGMYLINHPKIKALGKVVWEMNDSYLVRAF